MVLVPLGPADAMPDFPTVKPRLQSIPAIWEDEMDGRPSGDPSVSSDGSAVAFVSTATNLTETVLTPVPRLYVRSNRTVVIDPDGSVAVDPADPVLSANGAVVAFTAQADRSDPGAGRTVPSDLPSGDHLLVIVGRDAAGDPLYVVGQLSSVAPGPGDQPSDEVPDDAPVLPPSGPEVPGDPGPPPAAPDLGDISPATTIPPETTTTTTLPGVTPTDPAGPTPTNPDGTPVDPDDQAAPGGQGDGSDGEGTRKVFGTLPVTGATVGGFLVLAAILIAAGVLLRRAGSRP